MEERLVVPRGVQVILQPSQLLNVVMRASKGYEFYSQRFFTTVPLYPCMPVKINIRVHILAMMS